MSLLNGGKASWSILNTSGENQCFHVSSYFTSFTKPLLLHYGYYAARLILTLRSVIEKARAKPVGVQRHFSSSSPSRKKKQEDNVVGFPTTKPSGILAGNSTTHPPAVDVPANLALPVRCTHPSLQKCSSVPNTDRCINWCCRHLRCRTGRGFGVM
ncbi:hypothetical protein IG631_20377 [Alternaria alternata]|nr:hypothetical protein IG631_20377 [Alternaria alternata]